MALVQRVASATGNTTSGTFAVTVAAATTAGNLLVLASRRSAGFHATAVTDTRGNTWVIDKASTNSSGPGTTVASAKITTALQVGDTITIAGTGGTNAEHIGVYEYAGLDTTVSRVDQANQNNNTASQTSGSASVTTVNANDLIFTALGQATNQASWTVPTGFALQTSGQPPLGVADRTVTSTGTVTANWSWPSTGAWSLIIVAYKAAVSGVTAASAQTLPSFTQTAAGLTTVPAFHAASAQTLPSVTQQAAGTRTVPSGTALAAQTLPTLTQAAAGVRTVPAFHAAAVQTLPPLGQTAVAGFAAYGYAQGYTGGYGPANVTAGGAQTLPSLTGSGAGTVHAPTVTAIATQTLPAVQQTAAGHGPPTITATAALTLPALTQAGLLTANTITPTSRTYTVHPETRTVRVTTETRTVRVHAEHRILEAV